MIPLPPGDADLRKTDRKAGPAAYLVSLDALLGPRSDAESFT